MSGIVGSYFNTRGSGIVAKLGTDGQIFTSAGAGLSQGFEAAAGGGKVLQAVIGTATAASDITSTTFSATNLTCAITCATTSSRVLLLCSTNIQNYTGESALTFLRDSTNVTGTSSGITREQKVGEASPVTISWLDSPSSTSEIDYYLGAAQGDGNSCLTTSGSNQKGIIIAIEIGG